MFQSLGLRVSGSVLRVEGREFKSGWSLRLSL